MNNVVATAYPPRIRAAGRDPNDDPGRVRLGKIMDAALRRAGLGLAVAVVTVALVLAYAATRPPLYTAYGQILVDPRQASLTAAEPPQPGRRLEANLLDTEVELVGSRAVADALARRYRLDRDPEFNPAGRSGADAVAFQRVVDRVRHRITVDRDDKSHLITVGFASGSPRKAAMLANGVIEAFLQADVNAKVARFERADGGVRTGLETMRRQVEAAEQALAQYRNAHGLYGPDDQVVAEKEASLLNEQVATAQADAGERRAAFEAAQRQAGPGGSLDEVGAATTSPAMRALRKTEAEVSIRLAQLKTDFKPEYPEVKRAQAQLNDIRAAIQQETRRVLSGLRAEAGAAAGRSASLSASRGAIQGALAARDRAEPELFSLEQTANSAKQVYAAYLKRIGQIAAARDLQRPDAWTAAYAYPPLSPTSPNMVDMSLLAIVLGGLGGAGAITIAELWNRTVRTRAEVERLLGLSVAGVLPEFRTVAARKHRRRRPQDYLVSQPFSSFAESFRSLYAFLSLRGEPQPGRRIAVTSAIPGEGKSLTCLCLGRAMALSGKRVVAVDCDLRRQGLTRAFGEARRGVVQVVEGSLPLEDALQFDDASGLWLLPATPDAVPEDLFARPEIDALFERLSREFDYVLLDTPPILGVADARIVSAKADQVLLAVRWDRTPLRTVQGAAQILRDCGTTIAGAVLTRVDVGRYAGFGEAGASPYHRAYRRYFREPAPLEA